MLEIICYRWLVNITLLWAGMILGSSFLENWIKFRTPTFTNLLG